MNPTIPLLAYWTTLTLCLRLVVPLSPPLYPPPTPTPPPIPFSQHPQALPDDGAQDAATLLTTTHGIRVRDFAYENTLPPVTTVPRFTVQIQPRPRTLKRARDMLASAGRDDGEESDEEDEQSEESDAEDDVEGDGEGERDDEDAEAVSDN